MKLTHPQSKAVVETTPDLAGPYLRQGWSETKKPTKTAARASTKSETPAGEIASTTQKENNDGD